MDSTQYACTSMAAQMQASDNCDALCTHNAVCDSCSTCVPAVCAGVDGSGFVYHYLDWYAGAVEDATDWGFLLAREPTPAAAK